jgi:tRNA pseudouridine13 synthase
MKLKSQPTDFKVKELTDLRPSQGQHALYQLCKISLGTPEAIQAILRTWNLARHQIGYGGLKDRHAQTTQFMTIQHGPQRDLEDRSFQLIYVGQVPRPFAAQDIAGNQFDIMLRGITASDHQAVDDRLQLIQPVGLVNYFDDQRFGSLGKSRQFIAQPWCQGDYERALYLAMAEENSHDRGREQQQKQILRECWGNWQQCKDKLDRSHRRSIVTFLCDHPTNFKRAVALIRSDLRSIYLAAFQSGLWNQWLSQLIENQLSPHVSHFDSAVGPLALPIQANCDQAKLKWLSELSLPLPTARQHQWPEEHVGLLDQILTGYQMERREIRLKYPRDTFFSKGTRLCWLKPREFSYQWMADELHPGKQSLQLSFCLPRGAYATMLVKVLQGSQSSEL